MSDRKTYWNKEYTQYWKELTNEANDKHGDKTSVRKLSTGDYKTVGNDSSIALFDELIYLPQDKLLDYGCGFGRFFDFFSARSIYYGIDISDSMIAECVKKYPEHANHFRTSEGEELPFEDEFFDKIICFGVFDACYQETAICEMLRVLKVGGRILVTGKNNHYHEDDEQAYIAEEAARKKGHPNYFTDVKYMLQQLNKYVSVEKQRFYRYRGDFGKEIYTMEMPEQFYEYALILKKTDSSCRLDSFKTFAYEYSKTWQQIRNGK